MRAPSLTTVVRCCERWLKTDDFADWDGAVNGLQVENRGTVSKIAATVDASLATVKMAVSVRAELLIVHHGLFWGKTHPWTGTRYAMQRLLLENNLAVYSSHLPLDAHPQLGNNAQLTSALALPKGRPFFPEKGRLIGLRTQARISREELGNRLKKVLGRRPIMLPGGSAQCKKIGIVTGGAGGELKRAAAEGVDTFITGEGPHWTYALAEELGINVFYGGHYATETFGVKALSAQLSKKFGIPWVFLDHPTGL